MKTMKKSLIAVSVATIPLSGFAELQPMDDTQMSGVTGQAGVTIELTTAASIDQIEYSQGESTGSVLMDNVRIGGHDDGDPLEVDINIDLADTDGDVSGADNPPGDLEDGDALIELRPQGDTIAPVQVGVDMGSLGLESSDGSDSATLISDLSADFWVSQLDITARTENTLGGDDANGSIRIRNRFAAELDVDFDVAAVSLEGVRMAGAGTMSDLQESDPNFDALAVSGMQINAEIGSGDTLSGASDIDESLRVDLEEFNADIWMPTVNVGSNSSGDSSIGSVGISNLNLTDTQMAIYGRE